MSCHSRSSLCRVTALSLFPFPGLDTPALHTCTWLPVSATAICLVLGCHARCMRLGRGSVGLMPMCSCSLQRRTCQPSAQRDQLQRFFFVGTPACCWDAQIGSMSDIWGTGTRRGRTSSGTALLCDVWKQDLQHLKGMSKIRGRGCCLTMVGA